MMHHGHSKRALPEIAYRFMYRPFRYYQITAISVVRFSCREPRSIERRNSKCEVLNINRESVEERRPPNSIWLPKLFRILEERFEPRKVKIRRFYMAIKEGVAGVSVFENVQKTSLNHRIFTHYFAINVMISW
jgi:hypothetical protein